MIALLAKSGTAEVARRGCHPLRALVCAAAMTIASTGAASAGSAEKIKLWNQTYDLCMEEEDAVQGGLFGFLKAVACSSYATFIADDRAPAFGGGNAEALAGVAAAPLPGITATYQSDNSDAALDPGEPTYRGAMHKTIWQTFKLPKNARVVINTFGTGFDTVLAVYTGTSLPKLKLIAASDNYAVTGTVYSSPGFATRQSLVQFDATANVPYHVQIGSRDGSEGDVFTNVSYQPPGGGLSATLVSLDGFSIAYQGRNYECGFFGSALIPCRNPTYLVHNSTSQALEVTPASTLGAGIVAPAKFTLGAGKARAVTFVIGNAFNTTTVRTISGKFTFTGRFGANVVANEAARALIVVGPNAEGSNALRASVTSAHVRAAGINEETTYIATLPTTGVATAVGCHVRRTDFEPLLSNWQLLHPTTGRAIGAVGAPFNLGARKTATLRVFVASQAWRVADTRGGASRCSSPAPIRSRP